MCYGLHKGCRSQSTVQQENIRVPRCANEHFHLKHHHSPWPAALSCRGPGCSQPADGRCVASTSRGLFSVVRAVSVMHQEQRATVSPQAGCRRKQLVVEARQGSVNLGFTSSPASVLHRLLEISAPLERLDQRLTGKRRSAAPHREDQSCGPMESLFSTMRLKAFQFALFLSEKTFNPPSRVLGYFRLLSDHCHRTTPCPLQKTGDGLVNK